MKNNLISREALKKTFENLSSDSYESPLWYEDTVFRVIDNAPTVCGNNPKWCESCVSKGKCASTRPQGEWIFLKANEEQTDGYECSVCKTTYHTRVPYFSEFNFCPSCGAKMKGGAE